MWDRRFGCCKGLLAPVRGEHVVSIEPEEGGRSGSIELSYLATIMSTSIRELEDTYFRWLRRSDDRLLAAFDAYDAAATGTYGH